MNVLKTMVKKNTVINYTQNTCKIKYTNKLYSRYV